MLPGASSAETKYDMLDGRASLLLHQFEEISALVLDDNTRQALKLLSQFIQDVQQSVHAAIEDEVSCTVQSIEWRPHVTRTQPTQDLRSPADSMIEEPCQSAASVPCTAESLIPVLAPLKALAPQRIIQRVEKRDVPTLPSDQPRMASEKVSSTTDAHRFSLTSSPTTAHSSADLRASAQPSTCGALQQPARSFLLSSSQLLQLGPPAEPPVASKKLLLASERQRAFNAKQQPPALAGGSGAALKPMFAETHDASDSKGGNAPADAPAVQTPEEQLRAAQRWEESSKSTLPLWLQMSAGMPVHASCCPRAREGQQDATCGGPPDHEASRAGPRKDSNCLME